MDSQIETYRDYIMSLDLLFYRIKCWSDCGLNGIVPPYIYIKRDPRLFFKDASVLDVFWIRIQISLGSKIRFNIHFS